VSVVVKKKENAHQASGNIKTAAAKIEWRINLALKLLFVKFLF
jgi:hypothetical protein